jgi:hypothetical protein
VAAKASARATTFPEPDEPDEDEGEVESLLSLEPQPTRLNDISAAALAAMVQVEMREVTPTASAPAGAPGVVPSQALPVDVLRSQ